ncbi:MAG: DUF3108 domain-containing protein [Candidatus Omnitrophota bacterium]
MQIIINRRSKILFLLFLVIVFFYFWHSPELQQFLEDRDDFKIDKTKSNNVFEKVGEKISYDVMLGKVRVGQAQYHHLRKTDLQGIPVHLITFETQAVRFRDRETIYCDAETFLPLLVERKISQLITPEKIKEVYDQKNYTLTITHKRFTQEVDVIRKDGPIHNSILLPYFLRKEPELKPGWSFEANLPQGKYKIKLSRIEEIEVPAGRFKAFYLESEPSKIKIWISADEKKVPLKLEGTGSIGYKLLMREYMPPEKK